MTAKENTLRLGAWQFRSSASIENNRDAILRGLDKATKQQVRLLATQECALTGYAGVDRATTADIDRTELQKAEREIADRAAALQMAVVLGTTVFPRRGGKPYNAVRFIAPDGRVRGTYVKRAAYEDDAVHYATRESRGVFSLDGFRIGLRICFEFRFPEYLRALLFARADLAVIAFSMVGPDDSKRGIATAHLRSRAAENVLPILTANSLSAVQNAPTCFIDHAGTLVREAPADREALLVATLTRPKLSPLQQSIRKHARRLNRT